MRAWLAAGLAAGAIGWAASHPGSDPAPLPYPSYQADQPAPGDIPKTAGMSDREWCRSNARNWESKGAVVPDDWQCQGKPMGEWRK